MLRDYIDTLDVDAAHRDALELRYDRLKALMRKYGGSADEVLAYLEEARTRLSALEEFAADEERWWPGSRRRSRPRWPPRSA